MPDHLCTDKANTYLNFEELSECDITSISTWH